MDYEIVFSSDVQTEMRESYDWYEEKQSGLGERFIECNRKFSFCNNPSS